MMLLKVANLVKMRTNIRRNAEKTENFEKAILKQIQMCSNHIIIKAVKKHKRNLFLYVSAHYYVTIAIVSKVQAWIIQTYILLFGCYL